MKTARLEWALLALASAPLLLGASDQIQEVDPAQYAEVGRRMFESGDGSHLKDAFGPFLNKPPVTFWLMSGAFRVFGETSFAVRLPSLAMGLVLLWATARIGRHLFDRRTGLLGSALLAASPAFQLMVADPKVDMFVTGFMALAVLFMLQARRRAGWAFGAWIAAALGNLSKGWMGIFVPAGAVLPEALRAGWILPTAADRNLRGRLLRLQPILGPLLLAAVMAPWYWANFREYGTTGPRFLIWDQTIGRLLGTTWRNDTSPLFFVHTALWAFLPFTPTLLDSLVQHLRAFRRERFRLPPDPRRVLVWWLAFGFAGISAVAYRLPQYLYWLSPAAALLAAAGLLQLSGRNPGAVRALTWIQSGIAALALALVAGLLAFCFPPSAAVKAAWLGGLAMLLGIGHWLWRRKDEPVSRLEALAVLSLTTFNLFFQGYLHPALLAYQPDQAFGERVRQIDPGGTALPFVRLGATNASAFYARRDVREVDAPELARMVARGEAHTAVVAPEALADLGRAGLRVQPILERASFPTARPTGRFLRARTRSQVLERRLLVAVSLK